MKIGPLAYEYTSLKDLSILSSGSHLVYRSGTILSSLVERQLGIIPVKSESNWPKGLGEKKTFKSNFLRCSIFSSGGHFVRRSKTVLSVLIEGHLINIPIKFERNRPRGIGAFGVLRFFYF